MRPAAADSRCYLQGADLVDCRRHPAVSRGTRRHSERLAVAAYFNRNSQAVNDYTMFETSLWGQALTTIPGLPPSVRPYLNGPYYPSGFTPASSFQGNLQNNITQEFRLQNDNPAARINWVVGFFYSHDRQTAVQIVSDPGLHGFISNLTGGLVAPDLENGLYTFVQNPVIARDEQKAVYAQADFKLTQQLTLTAGIRAADTKFNATANYHGFVVGPPVNVRGGTRGLYASVPPRMGPG